MQPDLPNFGALLIGDELLTGKRSDRHWPKVIELLAARGLELSWLRVIGDDAEALESELGRIFASDDYVVSFGGIGATPDDRTRQSAAKALGRELLPHPQAVAEIEAQYEEAARPQRIKMAEFPVGAELIPNPVNRVPGFSVGATHFLPGFPEMAWPMLDWLLARDFPDRGKDDAAVEYSLKIYGIGEGELIHILERLENDYSNLKVSSLPTRDAINRCVEIGVRGHVTDAEAAAIQLDQHLRRDFDQPMTWLFAPAALR